MYALKNRQIVLGDTQGRLLRVIADVPDHDHRDSALEAAALLVSKANLADRDEALLDHLSDMIAARNQT